MSTRIAKPHPPMRKEPRQARSRATVEAIVTAGARVLGGTGWAGFTTNGVAEIAGVSIGSLYQYFPDKLSLIEAIRRRHFDDVLAVLRRAVRDEGSLEQRVTDLVDGMIEVHCIHPALHRVLLDEVPGNDGSRAAHAAFQSHYQDCYRAVVLACRNKADGTHEITAQVLSAAVEGVIHNAARRGALKSPDLRRELIELACAYLQSGADQ